MRPIVQATGSRAAGGGGAAEALAGAATGALLAAVGAAAAGFAGGAAAGAEQAARSAANATSSERGTDDGRKAHLQPANDSARASVPRAIAWGGAGARAWPARTRRRSGAPSAHPRPGRRFGARSAARRKKGHRVRISPGSP